MGKVIVLHFEDSDDEIIQDILELLGEKYPRYDKLEPNLIMRFEGFISQKPWKNPSPRAKASISHALKNTHFQAANPLNFPSKTTISCGFILHFSPKPQFGI